MNIQLFATWEELINEYNNEINNTQAQISNLNSQKQQDLQEYENYYNTSLGQYDEMQKQQQNYIDTYKQQQTDIQNKQTEYEIGLVNQNKEEAKKQTQKDIKNAYVDYMKATNQYGTNAEQLDEQGLSSSGYAETTQAMMFNTYQNRVGTAKEALSKANTQYDNQIQQALLTNDANLAQIALQTMQQSYQLALQGFEYKSTMAKEKINYTQALDTSYQNREQDLASRIDNYRKNITSIKQYQEEMAEKQRQFNQEMALQQQKNSYNSQTYNYSDSGNGYSSSSGDSFGNSQATMNKSDYYFKSTTGADYQPRYINNTKLTKSGLKLSDIGTIKGVSGGKNIWEANGRYYVWDEDTYIDVTSLYKSSTASKSGSGKQF